MASIRPSRSTIHAVGLGSEVGVMGDDDEGLAEFVAQMPIKPIYAPTLRLPLSPIKTSAGWQLNHKKPHGVSQI